MSTSLADAGNKEEGDVNCVEQVGDGMFHSNLFFRL